MNASEAKNAFGEHHDASKVVRVDGWDKVTGNAEYTLDVSVQGMAHARALRSPHAHARILHIDAAEAEAMPGVLAVVTGKDAAPYGHPVYGLGIADQPILTAEKVRYVGDIVAAVVAEDEATAIRALHKIKVAYEVLPALMSIDDSLEPGAPLLFDGPTPGIALPVGSPSTSVKDPAPNVPYEFSYRDGDFDAVAASAAHVFTDTFQFSAINHFHLEPHVSIARLKGRRIEVWSCNQDPFFVREDVARIFGRSTMDIVIYTSYVGGGFGGKSFTKFEPLNVLLALRAGRPVRLAFGMDESISTLTKHAARLTLTTAVSADGELLARRSRIDLDGGAYSDASAMTTVKVGYRITGPYRWKAVDTRSRVVRTSKVPAGSFRGFGGTQATFASESQIDMIARRLNIDPLQFRRQNFLSVGEPYRPGDSAMDSDIAIGLDEVAAAIGYSNSRVMHASNASIRKGMGIAVGLKDGGGSGNHASASLKIMPSGRAMVRAGTVELGQGASTAMCRIVSEELRIPLDWVSYGAIDTDKTPLNNGTNVSCGTVVTGAAVQSAAVQLREKVMKFAASQFGCCEEDVALESGWKVSCNGNVRELDSMIQGHYGLAGFEFTGEGAIKLPSDRNAPISAKNPYWMISWVAAQVDVDIETGMVRVQKLVVAGDAGKALDLKACLGQIEGAAIQAYGQALFEELAFVGEWPANSTPLTYRVPQLADLPAEFHGIVFEQRMGSGPYQLKGLGESGMLAVAAAICNAIHDATGVRIRSLPVTAEKVLDALDEAKALRLATVQPWRSPASQSLASPTCT